MFRSFFAVLFAICFGTFAVAEQRIALVVGNADYNAIGSLANPVSDATLITESLRSVGFQVTAVTDSSQNDMKRAIADFGRSLRDAGPDTVALFYYAGHAVQSFGNNYLLPVDAAIRDQADLDLVGIEADWVLRQLRSAQIKTSIVILDACRNNPFEGVQGFEDQGLAEMNAPRGTFIAYSTAPGMVAYDGITGNSPFTAFLARGIQGERKPIELLFKDVRVNVVEATQGKQTPWDSSSLTRDFHFRTASEPASAEELAMWQQVQITTDSAFIQAFVQKYPNSQYRTQALELLVSSISVQSSTLKIEKAPGNTRPAPPALVTFDSPLPQGADHIKGRTFAQLIVGQPQFPPFEGIPDELWKGQQCTNCHQWDRALLCEQGQFYLSAEAERSLGKEHPYGGTFKANLRRWADNDCR